jgi:hypothetical protein
MKYAGTQRTASANRPIATVFRYTRRSLPILDGRVKSSRSRTGQIQLNSRAAASDPGLLQHFDRGSQDTSDD